jgi:hypothetical protein
VNKVDTARTIYQFAVAFALICAVAVPVAYQSYSRGEWRRHSYGRHLMGSDTLLAVILGSYFIMALLERVPSWIKWLILAGEMVVFGFYRIQRVRFMRRSTQSTGYDNQPSGAGENERNVPS